MKESSDYCFESADKWHFELFGGPLDGLEFTMPFYCETMSLDGHSYEWATATSNGVSGCCVMCHTPGNVAPLPDEDRVIYDGVDLTGIYKQMKKGRG